MCQHRQQKSCTLCAIFLRITASTRYFQPGRRWEGGIPGTASKVCTQTLNASFPTCPTQLHIARKTPDAQTKFLRRRKDACSCPLVTTPALVTLPPLHRMTPRTTMAHERRRGRERLLAAVLAAPQLQVLQPQDSCEAPAVCCMWPSAFLSLPFPSLAVGAHITCSTTAVNVRGKQSAMDILGVGTAPCSCETGSVSQRLSGLPT